jgi:hypothetical protein
LVLRTRSDAHKHCIDDADSRVAARSIKEHDSPFVLLSPALKGYLTASRRATSSIDRTAAGCPSLLSRKGTCHESAAAQRPRSPARAKGVR